MNRYFKKLLSTMLFVSVLNMTVSGATVTVKYRATVNPGKLVSVMLVDPEADVDNLKREDIHTTAIMEADENGIASKTVTVSDALVDSASGKISNFKLLSNEDITEEIISVKSDNKYFEFENFAVRPVEENGVLFVPVAETLELIGADTVSYTYNKSKRSYTGESNNGEFTIIVGNDTIEVDWVDVELPATVREINGCDMMPAYAIKYVLKTGDVTWDDKGIRLSACVQEKFPERDIDMDSIVSNLPAPTKTIGLGHYSKDTNSELVTLSDVKVNIDGQHYTAKQIETTHDKFGVIPELGGIQVLRWQVNGDFNKKEIGLLSFKARATRITDESGVANVGVYYQGPGFHAAVIDTISITDSWQQFHLPAYNAFYDLPGSYQSRIMFQVGGKPMTIQIADMSIVSYGINDSVKNMLTQAPEAEGYKGIEKDHVWRQEAWNRVEKYRKEDITAEVVDSAGNPVSGAQIKVNMTENEFMFGAAMCENEILNLDMSTKKGKVFDSFMSNDINTGVCADMMKSTEVVNGNGILGIDMVNEYLRRGLRVRGHCMYWDGVGMSYLDSDGKENYDAMYRQTMDYVRTMAHLYKGKLEQWDVINEPVSNNTIRLDYKTTRLYSDIFKEIHKIDPDVKLYINETGIEGKEDKNMHDRISGLISGIVNPLKKEGAPVHGIGIQAHCSNYYYPQGFYHQIDECAQAVDEIAVTEYDLYNEKTEYAPNHLEDMVLATISHPQSTAFIVWNPEDSMHWRWADAAPFFKRDFSSKPAHLKWQELVNEVYATNEELTTDESGKAIVRAFRGDYEITCTYNGVSTTAYLGNTSDDGSSVRFVVDSNGITSSVSNEVRVKKDMIDFETFEEADRDYDNNHTAEYVNILADVNFKGAEYSDLVVNGGNLETDLSYQNGEIWGSEAGVGKLLGAADDVDIVIKNEGDCHSGYLLRKTRTKMTYSDSSLCFETMFSTLSPGSGNSLNLNCGLSDGVETEVLGSVIYDNGVYSVKALDQKLIALDNNTDYTLQINIEPSGLNYNVIYNILKSGNQIIESYVCKNVSLNSIMSFDELNYHIDTTCTASAENLLKLHNVRLYEHRAGEIIEFDRADLEHCCFDEDMNFEPSELEYLGTKLTAAPKDWSLIGANNSSDFEFVKYRAYIAPVQKNRTIGTHSLAKGFDSIKDGESLEMTFDLWLNATAPRMDSVGTASISLGSADKSALLSLVEYSFTPYYDTNTGTYPFELKLLQNGDTYNISRLIDGDNADNWKNNFISVNVKLNYNAAGYYSAVMTATNSSGESVSASSTLALTKEQAMKLDTVFVGYSQQTSGTNNKNQAIFGLKNMKINKFGKTMYTDGVASIASKTDVSAGIRYNNITGAQTDATIVIAIYNGGNLVYSQFKNVTFEKGEGYLNLDIPGNVNGDNCRVYLIDDVNTLSSVQNG